MLLLFCLVLCISTESDKKENISIVAPVQGLCDIIRISPLALDNSENVQKVKREAEFPLDGAAPRPGFGLQPSSYQTTGWNLSGEDFFTFPPTFARAARSPNYSAIV